MTLWTYTTLTDSASCGHVDEDYFVTKVIANAGRTGGYFAVGSLTEAEERWPSVTRCE